MKRSRCSASSSKGGRTVRGIPHKRPRSIGTLHFELDVGFQHADRIAHDVVIRWRTKDLYCPDVELCAMQGSDHLGARDLSFGQRTLLVRTSIVERKEFTTDVE